MSDAPAADGGRTTVPIPADESPAASISKRKRIAFRLGAAAFVLFLTLLLAEGVLRIYVSARGWTANCYAGSAQLLVPDDTNGYRLAEQFHLRSGIYAITTNSHGMRGPEIATNKPPGAKRVAILGGSSVFGYLVSDGQETARQLEAQLQTGGLNVEMLNAGVPGYNLFQTTERYRSLIAQFSPDVVVLYLGWNDLAYVVSEKPESECFRKRTPYPAWQRRLSFSTLYGLVAFRLLTPPAVFIPPEASRGEPTTAGAAQFRQNVAQLIADIREDGAEPVVCAQVMAAHPEASDDVRSSLGATAEQRRQNAELGIWLISTLREVAAEQSVPFIDASQQIKPSRETLGDAIHLTAAGEVRLAELLVSRLRPLLDGD